GPGDYIAVTGIALAIIVATPLFIRLVTGRSGLSFRVNVLAIALDLFLLIVLAAVLSTGRARLFFFHLLAWLAPISLLIGLEAAAIGIDLANRIVPLQDTSPLLHRGRWPGHLMSEGRWLSQDGLHLYRPWQGDGILINKRGLRTAEPTPKVAGEWRIAV